MFKQWIHHLFDPHCPDCNRGCESCETLKQQLEIANEEKERLLSLFISKQQPVPTVHDNVEEPARVSGHVSWRVRQSLLEAQSREEARLKAEKSKEIADLEKEVGI